VSAVVERLSKCVRTIHMCVRARALSPCHEEIHVNLYCLSPKRPSQTAPCLCQVQRRSHQNITPSSYAFSPVTLYIYKTQSLFLCRYHHIYIYIPKSTHDWKMLSRRAESDSAVSKLPQNKWMCAKPSPAKPSKPSHLPSMPSPPHPYIYTKVHNYCFLSFFLSFSKITKSQTMWSRSSSAQNKHISSHMLLGSGGGGFSIHTYISIYIHI
jgi:hypothetical protein